MVTRMMEGERGGVGDSMCRRGGERAATEGGGGEIGVVKALVEEGGG